MTRPLGRRLGLGFAAIAVAAALLTALVVNLAFSSRFDTYLEQQRSARTEQMVAAVSAVYQAAGRWDRDRLDQLAPAVAMAGADVRLLDPAGELLWPAEGSDPTGMAQMHRTMMETGPLTDPVSVPLTIDGQLRGTLQVALPVGSVPVADQQLRASVNQMLLAGGLAVALAASVFGMVLARRVTRPVAELTAAARDLRGGNRSRRAAVTGDDEVAELGRAFNELAESAERQETLRRSFTADVAHEFRTPLAILRSQLEAIQDGVLELSPALVASLHEETLRLGRLVADLETLTSAEAASFSLHRDRVDLADVVRSVAASFQHRVADAQLALELRLGAAPVQGDRTRLAQVVTNLLTNALKYVPAGGRVTLTTAADDHQVQLRVEDDGPGIPDPDLPRVFDRYFRGSARADGSGIGLAVVAALVQAHAGTVTAGNSPDGGAVITVTLPATDQPPAPTPVPAPTRPPTGRPADHTAALSGQE